MIRLVGIDVDGTLVGASGEVAPRVWEAAQRARAAGIRLALCSGRPAFGKALAYARELDASGWHIFQNGASVLDLASGRSRSVPVPTPVIQELIAEAHATQQLLELYSDRDWVAEQDTDWSHAHAQLLGVPFQARPFASLSGPIVRAQWLLSASVAQRVLAAPHPQLEMSEGTSPVMPETRFIGLTAAGVSKGSALRAVAEEYAISLEDTMYIGDAGNDLPALTIVGHPVVMQDAAPALRSVAGRVIGRAQDGAVADALAIALASSTAP